MDGDNRSDHAASYSHPALDRPVSWNRESPAEETALRGYVLEVRKKSLSRLLHNTKPANRQTARHSWLTLHESEKASDFVNLAAPTVPIPRHFAATEVRQLNEFNFRRWMVTLAAASLLIAIIRLLIGQ